MDEGFREIGAELFIENSRYLGIVRVVAGAERVISIDQAVEELHEEIEDVEYGKEELKVHSLCIDNATQTDEFEKYVFILLLSVIEKQRSVNTQTYFLKILLRQLSKNLDLL